MNKINIGAQVTAKVCPTKVTVSGTFQGYELQDKEDPTSVCGKVFYVKDGMQRLDFVYVDSIKACDSEDENVRKMLLRMCDDWESSTPCRVDKLNVPGVRAWLEKQKEGNLIEKKYIQEAFNKGMQAGMMQKPAEWSEEDERKYQCIRCVLLTDVDKKVGSWKYSEILDWYEKRGIGRHANFKPHWKPSEEQMKALNEVANNGVLLDLFNDLLKLL